MKWNWEKFYEKLSDWAVINLPRIGFALVVLFVGIWLSRVFSKWLQRFFERKQVNPSLRYFLLNLIVIAIQIIIVVIALQIAGIQLTFFAAIVAGLSVAAGLALSGTLQNFVSGILILLLRPYRVGDNVVMQGQEGTVSSIQLFYTIITTFDNKTIIVPNGQLSNNVTINLSREGDRRLDIELKFPYKLAYDPIRTLLMDILKEQSYILKDPGPRIGIVKLEPDRYTVTIQVWASAHGFEDTRLALQEKLMKELQTREWLT